MRLFAVLNSTHHGLIHIQGYETAARGRTPRDGYATGNGYKTRGVGSRSYTSLEPSLGRRLLPSLGGGLLRRLRHAQRRGEVAAEAGLVAGETSDSPAFMGVLSSIAVLPISLCSFCKYPVHASKVSSGSPHLPYKKC